MFKNLLITLMMGAASVCGAMELAEKHLNELKALHEAGLADTLQRLQAEAAYLQVSLISKGADMSQEEAQQQLNKILELTRQAYRMTKARYENGFCTCKQVLDARHALLMAEASAQIKAPETVDAEQQKLQQEYEQFLKQQQQAGVADAAERLEVQRILLMMQLFDNTTYPAQAEKIQKEIEQNYATAEALMQARYREGLAPYDEVENIRSQRRWFYRNLVLRSSTTSDIRKNQLQILQEELLQEYNDIATSDQVSPYTKLLRRLDYLSATRTAAAIHEN